MCALPFIFFFRSAPGTPSPPDLWTELKGLRDMVHSLGATVVEQKERLRNMEVRVAANEGEAKEQRNLVTDLRIELSVTKNKMETVEEENAGIMIHTRLNM